MLTKRLRKELQCLEKQPDEYIKLTAHPENIQLWCAFIRAPSDSVYNGYVFKISIDVGSDYPLAPPKMKFETKIFHPNVLFEVKIIFFYYFYIYYLLLNYLFLRNFILI
jgi:ubiquitin-protein ligase